MFFGNMLAKMTRIQHELGKRSIARMDCSYLDEWIAQFVTTADTYNEGAKLIERSTSKRIEANRKQRQPLDLSEKGVAEKAIQRLMTHSTPKTTQIYLEGGAAALADDDYLRVSAPLRLREILGE